MHYLEDDEVGLNAFVEYERTPFVAIEPRQVFVAVAPDKFSKGIKPGRVDVPHRYRVVELNEALEREYRSDAHLVTYVAPGRERQPRINKDGLSLFDSPLQVDCLFCDVDNADHAGWTDDLFEAAREQDATTPALQHAGVYYTAHGRRIVQPLAEPIAISEVETRLYGWFKVLELQGIAVDWACRDWTRHFRLPHVVRNRKAERSRCVDLEWMRPVRLPDWVLELAPEPAPAEEPSFEPAHRRPRKAIVEFTGELPARWQPLAERVAAALRQVGSEWHSPFLTLAGAFLYRQVPPEHVPALCGAISVLTSADDRLDDRLVTARTTVERWQQRLPVTGYRTLREKWPSVAMALDEALGSDSERQLLELTHSAEPLVATEKSLEEITRDLEQAIANAPPGLTLIKAQCGLGKTQAAMRVAAARAATPYASDNAQGLRAPPHSKTALSVDKNNLAKQCHTTLRVLQAPTARFFGPLSLSRDTEDGRTEHVCKLYDIAKPLVEGGLRMQWELCERRNGWTKCPHYDGCEARYGWEGDDPARVTLGTHALIGQLEGVAGPSGLLVIDEPQELLETVTLHASDLELAEEWANHWFDGEFVGALMPAISCFRVYLQAGLKGEALDAIQVVERVEQHVPRDLLEQAQRSADQFDGDVVLCARHAKFPKKHNGTSPPVRAMAIERMLSEQVEPWRLGKVARVLGTVHRALSSEYPASVRVEAQHEQRVLLVTLPRPALADAVRRDGSVVVLDANVELHAPILSKIVGYEPRMLEFEAPDGARIERTVLRTSQANRKRWFEGRHPKLAPSLLLAVQALVDWVLVAPGNGDTGIITFSQLEVGLRYALGLERDELREKARSMKWPDGLLDAFSEQLGPILARLPRTPLTGHYGAVRGLDGMKECDNLVTLGDPWMNLSDALNDAGFLGLGDQWESRFEARCRAELEQAHGRLRTIHRTRPGRALHIGKVLPSGRAWESGGVVVKSFEGGKLARPSAMTAEEFSEAIQTLGGLRKMARLIGKSPTAVANYRDGRTSIPHEVVEVLPGSLDAQGVDLPA